MLFRSTCTLAEAVDRGGTGRYRETTFTRDVIDEPPPFLKRWPNVYRFVLIYLAAVITLFYIFTAAYRP